MVCVCMYVERLKHKVVQALSIDAGSPTAVYSTGYKLKMRYYTRRFNLALRAPAQIIKQLPTRVRETPCRDLF